MSYTSLNFFKNFPAQKERNRGKIKYLARPAVFVFALCALSSCVTSSKSPQKSNLTAGVVKTRIHKGVTSQTDIVRLIGSPNIITKNKDGEEVWTYSRQSFDSESGGFGGGLIFFGGSQAFSSAGSKSFDLIITFNESSVVKDYSVVSSQF